MSEQDCMVTGDLPAFSIVIPVYNEAVLLERTVPTVLAAIAGSKSEVIYVCNGCRDDSAVKIRQMCGDRVRVIEVQEAGKTQAFNIGEAQVSAFPRFYLDSDVLVPPNTFSRLAEVLQEGGTDLVSPAIHFDTSGCSWAARKIADVWLELPHAKNGAFHHLLGVSLKGRSRWGMFPTILADDAYIESQIPFERRRIVADVKITTWAPSTFYAWARVRARWLQGQHELLYQRIKTQADPEQLSTLLSMLKGRKTCVPAMLYLLNRVVSMVICTWSKRFGNGWFHDRP